MTRAKPGKVNPAAAWQAGFTSLAFRKEQHMNCILTLALVAAAGYIGYRFGRRVGYDEAMSQGRRPCSYG
jgi:hypothetical protein